MAGSSTPGTGNGGDRPVTANGASFRPGLASSTAALGRGEVASSGILALPPTSAGAGSKPAPPRRAQRGVGAGGAAHQGRYVHTATREHLDIESDENREIKEFSRGWSRQIKRARLRRKLAVALDALGRHDELRRVNCCGNWFRVRESACSTRKLARIGCDHLLCPDCSLERTKPLWSRLYRIFAKQSQDCGYRFLTLTVPNVPSIDREYLDSIISAFRNLRRQKFWSEPVCGGFYAMDTTYNPRSKTWHVHLHAVIELLPGIPKATAPNGYLYPTWLKTLKSAWCELTGGKNVHIRRVDQRAVKELLKYSAKAASFVSTPARVDEYLIAFKDVRRLQGWGSFLGTAKEKSEKPERCACGTCSGDDWRYVGVVSISETFEDDEGNRQLLDWQLPERLSGAGPKEVSYSQAERFAIEYENPN